MTNRLLWSLCRLLIRLGRRWAVPPPDIDEIAHYATCPRCRRKLKGQGWVAESKRDRNNQTYQVTFTFDDNAKLDSMCHEEDEDEPEVKRPERLTVGEEPKRPPFYV